ncbi:MAG: type I 3-dehydroquinate dehydratase [Deltaproteobacteria bacterium]|nr:type I 3-dehydroquinate dehydratase [Deltaproteobacteria bacterium]
MICVSVIAKDNKIALKKMREAGDTALIDMFEIRLDMMETFDIAELIRAAPKPLLVTYRSKNEGGEGLASPETRTTCLVEAADEGAALVDVEWRHPPHLREKIFDAAGRDRVVLSTHFCDGTPETAELENILEAGMRTGAGIIKIVTHANCWEDNIRVLQLISKAHDLGTSVAAFCMGRLGRISRVFSHMMGGCLTFASLGAGQESASGQISIEDLEAILRILST